MVRQRRSPRPGVEFVKIGGVARLRYSAPKFHDGDIVDLTLPIGSYSETITTRRLQIITSRRNQYSGRLEYQLKDDARNRIDYTRWFEEDALARHDIHSPDPVCKRLVRGEKQCKATPTYPSGLCIKHKAKLDWDRERQRKKLAAELELRKQEKTSSGIEVEDRDPPVTISQPPEDISDLLQGGQDDTSTQLSMRMWGEVDLFARTTTQSYFNEDLPTYRRTFPLPTPGLELQATRFRPYRTCLILIFVASVSIASSLGIALWWTLAHNDLSGAFTMAGYIVAVAGIVLFPIQSQHSKNCRCWSRPLPRTPAT